LVLLLLIVEKFGLEINPQFAPPAYCWNLIVNYGLARLSWLPSASTVSLPVARSMA